VCAWRSRPNDEDADTRIDGDFASRSQRRRSSLPPSGGDNASRGSRAYEAVLLVREMDAGAPDQLMAVAL
jgi:hypothetical protein